MQELVFLTTLLTFIVGGTVSSKVIFFAFFQRADEDKVNATNSRRFKFRSL